MSDAETTKEYTNGEVTIVWKQGLCKHAGNCVKGNYKVFNPKRRPWVDPEAASTDAIKRVIDTCPSGALSYRMNDEG